MPKTPTAPPLEFMGCPVKIVRAFQPGDVVFIECPKPLPVQAMQHISAEFKRMLPDMKVVVLQAGLKVVGQPEDGA